MRRNKFARLPLALLLAGLPLLGGCIGDEVLIPLNPGAGGEIFDRYVALGNSITAGFQSAGINDSTQLRAYPVLLARQAGAAFEVPLLNRPGCPPPFVAPLGAGGRVGDTPERRAPDCSLRASVDGPIQNLAVPGAQINSAFDNTVAANALTTFILGGRTQIETMLALEPTLVSAWLGNNDALGVVVGRGPILPGDIAALSSFATFNVGLDSLVSAIERTPAAETDAVVLIGVVQPTVTPLVQPGAYFFAAASTMNGRFNGKPVNPNCSPVTATGQPNPLSRNLVNFQIVGVTAIPEISCADDAPFVLNAAEQLAVATRVTEFNAAIQQTAAANNYIYIDPNALLQPFLAETNAKGEFNRLRKCQALATATLPTFAAAVQNSCPNPAAPGFFGSLISFDGVHPSSEAHQVITNQIIVELNAKFGLDIPLIPIAAIR